MQDAFTPVLVCRCQPWEELVPLACLCPRRSEQLSLDRNLCEEKESHLISPSKGAEE